MLNLTLSTPPASSRKKSCFSASPGEVDLILCVFLLRSTTRSVGGTIIAKDVNQNSDLNEWDGGQLGVIVEFESKAAAQQAFNSSEFQEYIKYSGIENQLSLSIIG